MRRNATAGGRSSRGGFGQAPVVGVVAAAADARWAEDLSAFLQQSGVSLRPAPTPDVDAVVVVLSPEALADQAWRHQVETAADRRLVPVARADLDAASAPPCVQSVNWIRVGHLAGGPGAAAFGTVIAAIFTEPALHREFGDLVHAADAWAHDGAHHVGLETDRKRALALADVLARAHRDPLLVVPRHVVDYVHGSVRRAKRRSRGGRWLGTAVLATAIVTGLIAALVIPITRVIVQRNNASITSSGHVGTVSEMPEWSALLAATLLLGGNPGQQEVARLSAREALGRPWAAGRPNLGGDLSLMSLVPIGDGSTGAVLAAHADRRSVLGVFELPSETFLWEVDLGGQYADVDVTADGRRAVVAGAAGVAEVDLGARAVRVVTAEPALDVVVAGTGGEVVLHDDKAVVVLGPDGQVASRESFEAVLSVVRIEDGTVRAIVMSDEDTYQIRSVSRSEVVAEVDATAGAIAVGAVLPDGESAVFAGADRQLWTFGRGRPLEPTGVGVPDRTTVLVAVHGGRVVVGGQAEPAFVLHLPSRSRLGVLCGQTPGVFRVRPSATLDVIACRGNTNGSFWRMPAGPLATPPEGLRRESADEVGKVRVEARDSEVQYIASTSTGRLASGWQRPTSGPIRAVSLSDDGARVVIATDLGEVVVVDVSPASTAFAPVVRWQTPDGAAVVAAGWRDGPIVETAAGNVWKVPDCEGCGTLFGLVAAIDDRLPPCWQERQLAFVPDSVRAALGVKVCQPWTG